MEHSDAIKFLGANGARTKTKGSTCIQLTDNMVIDGGHLIYGLGDGMLEIDTIFLTHPHLDHICDIPFLADEVISNKKSQITIYALAPTLKALKEHIFNDLIWPDFSQIKLPHSDKNVIKFVEIEVDKCYEHQGITLTPVKTDHTQGSCGYIVKKDGEGILITADTYCCDTVWERLNRDKEIHTLCIDVSFPSKYVKLAFDSKHLTPKLLHEELTKLHRDDVRVCLMHLKPSVYDQIAQEVQSYNLLKNGGVILQDNDIIYFNKAKKDK